MSLRKIWYRGVRERTKSKLRRLRQAKINIGKKERIHKKLTKGQKKRLQKLTEEINYYNKKLDAVRKALHGEKYIKPPKKEPASNSQTYNTANSTANESNVYIKTMKPYNSSEYIAKNIKDLLKAFENVDLKTGNDIDLQAQDDTDTNGKHTYKIQYYEEEEREKREEEARRKAEDDRRLEEIRQEEKRRQDAAKQAELDWQIELLRQRNRDAYNEANRKFSQGLDLCLNCRRYGNCGYGSQCTQNGCCPYYIPE